MYLYKCGCLCFHYQYQATELPAFKNLPRCNNLSLSNGSNIVIIGDFLRGRLLITQQKNRLRSYEKLGFNTCKTCKTDGLDWTGR